MGLAAKLLLALAAAAMATPCAAASGSRSFSDLCREAASDDLAGRVVRLSPTGRGWRVDYSPTDGVLEPPVAATAVRYTPASGRLTFQVKTWEAIRFAGRVAGDRLSGVVTSGGGRPVRVVLREAAGADEPYPACQ